ncbi:hypothetical protein [Devosia indica]
MTAVAFFLFFSEVEFPGFQNFKQNARKKQKTPKHTLFAFPVFPFWKPKKKEPPKNVAQMLDSENPQINKHRSSGCIFLFHPLIICLFSIQTGYCPSLFLND